MSFKGLTTAGILAALMTFAGNTIISAQVPPTEPGQPVANDDAPDYPVGGGMMDGSSMMKGQGKRGPGSWMGRGNSMVRHMLYMRNGLPSSFRGRFSTLASTPEAVRDGAALYAANCASCHGPRGFGDGEAGRGLNPPPANLAHMIRMPMLNDPYLLWTVADGGEPVGSDMPAFKGVLSEENIWKIVIAMRAGFPAPSAFESETGIIPNNDDAITDGLMSKADVRLQLEQWALWYGNPDLKVGRIIVKDQDTFVAEIVTKNNLVLQLIEINRRTGWMRPAK